MWVKNENQEYVPLESECLPMIVRANLNLYVHAVLEYGVSIKRKIMSMHRNVCQHQYPTLPQT